MSRKRLEIGASLPLCRRHARLGAGPAALVRLVYASDLHLSGGWTAHIVDQIVEGVRAAAPDVVLLGGDLVDAKAGLPLLFDCVERIAREIPLYAIPGNHDALAGIARVRACVEGAGGRWLEGAAALVANGEGETIRLDGACRTERCDPGVRSILVAHYPDIFPRAVAAGYDLVLAGHLHGGQAVLGATDGLLYPGALLSRWNALEFSSGATRMIVSRGVNDTLPIRWRCPRELIVCDIGGWPASPIGHHTPPDGRP